MLTSLHCGHYDKLRMRCRLTILQSGLHFPLCSCLLSSSQFGSNTDGRVHSVAAKYALARKNTPRPVSTKLQQAHKDVRPTYPRGTLRVSKIWTAIEVVPSTALPTPSYPDTTGQSQRNAQTRVQPMESRARRLNSPWQRERGPIPAAIGTWAILSIEKNYWMNKKIKK